MRRPRGILLVFLDGVGIGPEDPARNPFRQDGQGFFPQVLGDGVPVMAPPPSVSPLASQGRHGFADACLEVPGTPQSATGQATLFTGINCAKILGYHLTAFPNDALAAIVRRHNLLAQAQVSGYRAAFLNMYTPRFYELGWPHSVSTIAALSLERPLFMIDDMLAGRALYHDITQASLRKHYGDTIPVFPPEEAGKHLARAARGWDLALFEHFWTDRVGHKGDLNSAVAQVALVERFLDGLIEATNLEERLVVIASDHGNLEDISVRGHTTNPVPVSAWGPGADWLVTRVRDLTHVTPALLELLPPR